MNLKKVSLLSNMLIFLCVHYLSLPKQSIQSVVYTITNKGKSPIAFTIGMTSPTVTQFEACRIFNGSAILDPGETTQIRSPTEADKITKCEAYRLTIWDRNSSNILFDSTKSNICWYFHDDTIELIQDKDGRWGIAVVYPQPTSIPPA